MKVSPENNFKNDRISLNSLPGSLEMPKLVKDEMFSIQASAILETRNFQSFSLNHRLPLDVSKQTEIRTREFRKEVLIGPTFDNSESTIWLGCAIMEL